MLCAVVATNVGTWGIRVFVKHSPPPLAPLSSPPSSSASWPAAAAASSWSEIELERIKTSSTLTRSLNRHHLLPPPYHLRHLCCIRSTIAHSSANLLACLFAHSISRRFSRKWMKTHSLSLHRYIWWLLCRLQSPHTINKCLPFSVSSCRVLFSLARSLCCPPAPSLSLSFSAYIHIEMLKMAASIVCLSARSLVCSLDINMNVCVCNIRTAQSDRFQKLYYILCKILQWPIGRTFKCSKNMKLYSNRYGEYVCKSGNMYDTFTFRCVYTCTHME